MTTERADAEADRPGWNEAIGPFFGIRKVSQILGRTEEEVRENHRDRKLLGLVTKDGVPVFPSFQFVQNEEDQSWGLIRGLDRVLSEFAGLETGGPDDWLLASWLRVQRRDLKGESIEEHLKQGKELEPILAIARAAANRWSH